MPRVVPEQILEVVLPEVREAYARSMPRSLAVVPLRSRGKIIGALAAQRDQHPRDFGEADVELLQELAERAALAIENGRLYQDNERGRARAEILAGLAGAVNQAKTLEEVLEAAQLALGSATNAPRSAILLFDGEGVMRFRAWRGLSDEYRRAVDGHSPWSRDAQSPAPILVPDVRHDEAMAPLLPVFEREGIGSVGFIPLVAGRQLVGKFMVYFDGPHTFSAEEREMTAAIATHVAAGTARFASVEELQRTVHFNEMFTAMLGHDLRNPLAAMMMAAQVMLKREDTKALAKPLGRIVSSGNRMTRMIDQLLDFTRVRIGTGIPIRPKPTDVRVLVRQVLGELEDSQAPRAVNVESRGDSRGSWDGDRLAQVFSNLAANAIHYGDPEQPVDVVLDGSAPEQMVVSIHNGGAMEPALVAQLFEPMAGRDRRSGKSRGLGLGLFISRQMVLAHGGEIVVDSHPERGTTLTVTLPRPADFAP